MEKGSIQAKLKCNPYPGRGIIVGKSSDNKNAVTAYFIMGRSVNSRNRIFVEDGEGIRTKAFDDAKLSDPSLVIYAPVKVLDNYTIVTNGDQTDTVYDGIKSGLTFKTALETREFEPDAPNYTPRISAMLDVKDGNFSFEMSILKSSDGNGDICNRYTYSYENILGGEGRFIHTYIGDGNPLKSFEGEPERIGIDGNIDEFANMLWASLNNENKVSLFVRYININTGTYETRIFNKNK